MSEPKRFYLPTTNFIVPAHISEENLRAFKSEDSHKEIDGTYQRIKNHLSKKIEKSDDPSISVIFGSTGTGVRTLMQQASGIVCNAEDFAKELRSFLEAVAFSQDYDNEAQLRQFLQETTERFLPAGRYMQDRMMSEAHAEGYDVTLTKRGRSNGGIELLKAITRVGASLHTIIYQAPLDVKLKGFESSYKKDHGIALTPATIEAEHDSLTANMQKLADVTEGRLSIYFRVAKDTKKANTLVASSQNGSYIIADQEREEAFNECFSDQGITIASLMGDRARKLAL